MAKKHYLTATLPDGYVKTIGPTATPFTHYWRIVAVLANGRTEVFWAIPRRLRRPRESVPRRPMRRASEGGCRTSLKSSRSCGRKGRGLASVAAVPE